MTDVRYARISDAPSCATILKPKIDEQDWMPRAEYRREGFSVVERKDKDDNGLPELRMEWHR